MEKKETVKTEVDNQSVSSMIRTIGTDARVSIRFRPRETLDAAETFQSHRSGDIKRTTRSAQPGDRKNAQLMLTFQSAIIAFAASFQ